MLGIYYLGIYGLTLVVDWLLVSLEWSQLGLMNLFYVFYFPSRFPVFSWQSHRSDTQVSHCQFYHIQLAKVQIQGMGKLRWNLRLIQTIPSILHLSCIYTLFTFRMMDKLSYLPFTQSPSFFSILSGIISNYSKCTVTFVSQMVAYFTQFCI